MMSPVHVVQNATEAERSELRAAFGPRQARITAWPDSFGQGVVMPDEAAAFMYTQLAIEEMPSDEWSDASDGPCDHVVTKPG